MKPTVSASTIGPRSSSSSRRKVGSRVANNWSAAKTSESVTELNSVDLPALV
ncbi:hypothetical protein D3C81_1993280 [compost metagenome]